jgi:GTPase SAR1 family protein
MKYEWDHPVMSAIDHGILDREEILNRKVRIQVWDTAGQERFRNITKTFFKKADGLLLVYDCTNPDTLENISSWVN